jgi:hypothetical protein
MVHDYALKMIGIIGLDSLSLFVIRSASPGIYRELRSSVLAGMQPYNMKPFE